MDHRELDDTRLLELLGEVLDEVDPVPPDALELACAAGPRDLDSELAELHFDSLADTVFDPATAMRTDVRLDPAGVAGADGAAESDGVRTLRFAAGEQLIEVDLLDGDLVGRVTPPPDGPFEVLQATGVRPVDVDEQGFFRTPVDAGHLRLRFTHAGRVTTTPWITC